MKRLTVGDLKRLVAELPTELDDKELWYVEVSGHDQFLVATVQDDIGEVAITSDTEPPGGFG